MENRLALSTGAFYAGLSIVLVSGIGWGMVAEAHPLLPPGIMLVGAVAAVAARVASRRLERRLRRHDFCEGLGGYPLRILREPRFMSRRRHVA